MSKQVGPAPPVTLLPVGPSNNSTGNAAVLASTDTDNFSRIRLQPDGLPALVPRTADAAAPSKVSSRVLADAPVADGRPTEQKTPNALRTLVNVGIESANVRAAIGPSRREHFLQSELEQFNAALAKTFPSISPAAVDTVIQNSTRKIGPPGTIIFKEGDVSSDMIFLCSGILDIQKSGQVTAAVDCSSIVGHHAYLYSRPRSATVVVRDGPQCVYYIFSVDRVSDDADMKGSVWHASTTRVMTATAKSTKDNVQLTQDDSSINLVETDAGDSSISPLSKRRMSVLLGEGESARRYTRDVLDYGDAESNESPCHSQSASAVESCAVEHARESPSGPTEARRSPRSQDSIGSPRQRAASASHLPHTRTSLSGLKSPRPSTASAPRSSAIPNSFVDFASELHSPRSASSAAADATSQPMRSGQAAKVPNRKLSIVARTLEAVQQQLASTSAAASSCIIFSAAWLLCLTQLERLRMPEPRHAICR
jgi:CRP-like cAMP-binding protein